MFIQVEDTPNPSTLKFIFPSDILSKGTLAFTVDDKDEYKNSTLIKKLFENDQVAGIFCSKNFITITKAPTIEWDALKPEVLTILVDHLATGSKIIDENNVQLNSKSQINENDSEIIVQIKELLEERVRPAVAQDGGDIIFHDFEDGIVYLELYGACAGCPSATSTLKDGIENMLKHYIAEVKSVEAINL